MSAEMTVTSEMNAESVPPPEEPPKQENAPTKKTWTCSRCGKVIEWLPPAVRHLNPSKILCLECQKAKKAAEASADAPAPAPSAPAPVDAPASAPAPAREAPKHANQRRSAGGRHGHRAQAPREMVSLEVVELCAFRTGIAPPQVEALLLSIRRHMASANAVSSE